MHMSLIDLIMQDKIYHAFEIQARYFDFTSNN